MENVDAMRVRKANHGVIIELDRAKQVRLAPDRHQNQYQSRNHLHNIMISMLEGGHEAGPVPEARVKYKIRAWSENERP